MAVFTPYPHQTAGAIALLAAIDRCGSALDGSVMGSGKTYTALMVAKAAGLRVGIICIKQARAKWADAAALIGVDVVFVENREKLTRGNTPWVSRHGKKGKDFSWQLPHGTLLIFDECHKDSGLTSLNGSMLSAAVGIPCLLLSATAAESPLHLKAIGFRLGLHADRNFFPWARKMGATCGFFGGLEFDAASVDGQARLHALHEMIFPYRGFRVDATDLEGVLPEHEIYDEPIELSAADRKVVDAAYEEIEENDDLMSLTKSLHGRIIVEKVKVPYLIEEARNAVEEGGQAIIFLNFHESMDAAKKLLPDAPVIDGRVKSADREKARLAFQSGQSPYILVNTASGGQSIDLHDLDGGKPRVQILSPQYGAKMDEQATGRATRAGAKSRVITRRLYVAKTIEESVIKSLRTKHTAISIINKGNKHMTEQPVTGVLEHAEREHAPHSPSSLPNKSKCSGWRNDPSGDKTAANRGSLGHEAVEKRNITIIPPEDEWLRIAAQKCIDYVDSLTPSTAKSYKEVRVYYSGDQFGHLDEFVHCGNSGKLVDYKFAWNFYSAGSEQFKAYVLGLWKMFPEVNEIEVHVAHPFLDVIDVEAYSRADEPRLTAEVTAIVEAARRNDPTTYITGTQCAYCGNKASCPALSNVAMTVARNYAATSDEMVIPEALDPANITDPAMLAKAKDLTPILERWCAKINERALEMRLHEGIEIPGYELAERKSPFKITDAQICWEVVKDQITAEAFAACAEVKIGDLEKAIARVTPRGGKAKAEAALRDALIDSSAARSEGVSQFLKKSKLAIEV